MAPIKARKKRGGRFREVSTRHWPVVKRCVLKDPDLPKSLGDLVPTLNPSVPEPSSPLPPTPVNTPSPLPEPEPRPEQPSSSPPPQQLPTMATTYAYAGSAQALPVFMPEHDPTLPPNLLPNALPRMSATTGKWSTGVGPQDVSSISKYANGLMYIHSHQHIPDEYQVKGLTEHLWFSYHNIEVAKMVPGIPDPYFDDCARGHALYVTGLPRKYSPGEVALMFMACGRIASCIALVDMNSGETFRWVVMGSFEDAQKALKERQGFTYGSTTINVCYALPPGSALLLQGRSIANVLQEQKIELFQEDTLFRKALMECFKNQPAAYCNEFNTMPSAGFAPLGSANHTGLSPFVGYVYGEISPEARKNKLFQETTLEKWSPSFAQYLCDTRAASEAATPVQAKIATNSRSSMSAEAAIAQEHEAGPSDYSQSPHSSSGSDASTIVPYTAQRADAHPIATTTSVIARPFTAPKAPAPDAPVVPVIPIVLATPNFPVPAAVKSSWANIAAPVANGSSNLVFNLHSENKSSSTAPRVQAPANPNIVAYQQGVSTEEQKRAVIILNLPQAITLQNVSDAISEGPILTIQFATDVDSGKRYVGIIFQHAEHAKAFHDVLEQERRDSQPGRFRFLVDIGAERLTYLYDDELENMEPPMNGTRRLTIVKKAFFFLFTKRDLRKICVSLVGADKIQLIWLYNGGNASVVFADVKSAVAVKTKFDQMASSKAKFGTNMVSFEGLSTSFSKDPCLAPMNLYTDIADLNEE